MWYGSTSSRVLCMSAAQAGIAPLDLHVHVDAFLPRYQHRTQLGCWRSSASRVKPPPASERRDQDSHDPDSERFVLPCHHHALRLSFFGVEGQGCGQGSWGSFRESSNKARAGLAFSALLDSSRDVGVAKWEGFGNRPHEHVSLREAPCAATKHGRRNLPKLRLSAVDGATDDIVGYIVVNYHPAWRGAGFVGEGPAPLGIRS